MLQADDNDDDIVNIHTQDNGENSSTIIQAYSLLKIQYRLIIKIMLFQSCTL